jgi:hypothetical protein
MSRSGTSGSVQGDGSEAMFTSGGGGGGLPRVDGPVELLILLVVVGGILWIGYRLFSD